MIPGPGLLFGLMLLAAIVGGYAARSVHIPRVVGFLLGGVALNLLLAWLFGTGGNVEAKQALIVAGDPLHVIKDLALGLILFTIGGVFERSRFRSVVRRVLKISVLEMSLVLLFVFVGCGIISLITQSEQGIAANMILAVLLGTAAIATAPAATLFVLQEYDAKGPITDTILGLTGVNNIVCIVLFYSMFLVLTSLGLMTTTGALAEHLWLALAATTLGSVVCGILFGTLISILHAKLPLAETLLVFFALFILMGAGEKWLLEHNQGLSFNFLLTALVMGGVFTNVAIDSQKLETALRTFGSPIFAGFFVMAGYELHLTEMGSMGWLGAGYVLFRLLGKKIGGVLGVRRAGGPQRADGRLGEALLCQAAVVIGLASFVSQYWDSPLAAQFSTVILGSVVVFEFIGPLLVKRCVVQGGEVKAATLLTRVGSRSGVGSLVRLTLESLLRVVGVGPKRGEADDASMQVRHIMRTNVQFIPASANLDEVLHFIERSTYSHFPVVAEEGGFAGVIHFSDVRDVIYDPMLRDLVTAVDLTDSDSRTVPPDMSLQDLLDVFSHENVGVLPVAEDADRKRVVGVVEQRDLLRALHLPPRMR